MTLEQQFLDIDITDGYCNDHPCYCETPDMYNTGDSPTDYECLGTAKTCPRLEKNIVECCPAAMKMSSLNPFI